MVPRLLPATTARSGGPLLLSTQAADVASLRCTFHSNGCPALLAPSAAGAPRNGGDALLGDQSARLHVSVYPARKPRLAGIGELRCASHSSSRASLLASAVAGTSRSCSDGQLVGNSAALHTASHPPQTFWHADVSRAQHDQSVCSRGLRTAVASTAPCLWRQQQRRGLHFLPGLNGDVSKQYHERRLIGCA